MRLEEIENTGEDSRIGRSGDDDARKSSRARMRGDPRMGHEEWRRGEQCAAGFTDQREEVVEHLG